MSAGTTPAATRVYLMNRPDSSQSHIPIGAVAATRHPADYCALGVLNELFGGAFTSRLNNNIRQQKGYSYGVSSAFAYRALPGYWVAAGGVRTDVTRESLVEFMKEIRGLYSERPPQPA